MITLENKFLIKSGSNSIKYLFDYLKNYKSHKKLLIIDYNIRSFKIIKNLKNEFKKQVQKYEIFYYQSEHEPTYENLNFIKKKFSNNAFQLIIAIGGGSTLDFSKGLSLLLKNKGSSEKYMGFPLNLNKPLPVIAIPSTFNTGSEIVYNAVFTSKKEKKKLGINYNQNFPILAILEPGLISDSPEKLILSSAYSVFCRAVETYTTPQSNYISKNYSLFSYKLICDSLEQIFIKKNKKLEYYNKLQWAGINSMIALSSVGGGIGGIGAYFLSVNLKLPQSLGYGICSSEIFRENLKMNKNIYKDLNQVYNFLKMINFFDNKLLQYFSLSDFRFIKKDRKLFKKTYESSLNLTKIYNPCNFKKINLTNISNRILKKFKCLDLN